MPTLPKTATGTPQPYVKPVLQHLGSVRELTLGGLTVSKMDGFISFLKPGM